MEEKIYIGSAKEVKFQNGGSVFNISIELSAIPEEHIKSYTGGKRFANLTIGKRKEADKFGNTHWVAINTYKKPEDKPKAEKPLPTVNPDNSEYDLPF